MVQIPRIIKNCQAIEKINFKGRDSMENIIDNLLLQGEKYVKYTP